MADIDTEFVHLARLALEQRHEDAGALIRRAMHALLKRRPDLMDDAAPVLALASGRVTRSAAVSMLPVDLDSRLELLRSEDVSGFAVEPVWPPGVSAALDSVIDERGREKELRGAGLAPTRSLLFVGLPGVGKTLAARWLARRLGRPLLTLDLAAVMSSFLGRTGNNIRVVLEYARRTPSVLLLDEFDSIAKRRDDSAEVGELKRLVTVLLQAIDDWPAEGLLIAATNHDDLLDPAVWRRFERTVRFPAASAEAAKVLLERHLGAEAVGTEPVLSAVSAALADRSFADIARVALHAKRNALLRGEALEVSLLEAAREVYSEMPPSVRIRMANALSKRGYSQRAVADVTGVSRDTIRKHSKSARARKG